MSWINIFFEHVPIAHIHFPFIFVFKFSLKQTIFRLETCPVLPVSYGLFSLNVPISILSFISLGRSFFFTWRHHTLRQLSMLPDYLFYKMHFSAILFIHLFKIGLRIFSQNDSHFNWSQRALRNTVTQSLSFQKHFWKSSTSEIKYCTCSTQTK